MKPFEYARPASVKEAVALLSEKRGETAVLAGGTDLLSLMKDFLVEPKRVVSVMGIEELHWIKDNRPATTIGAAATLDELLASGVTDQWPALADAAQGIKSPQLRTMGTVGGELLQRPRCWYFRRGHGLLALDGGKSMVAAGDHRYHAAFGNQGLAKFVNPSSLAPALIALDASAQIDGPAGGRTVKIAELYRAPDQADESEFTLAANEVLTRISIPAAGRQSATYEVRPRQGLDWPLATASVNLRIEGGKVAAAAIVLGHVAPTPWRADAAAKTLLGKTLDAGTIDAAAKAAVAGATPLPKNAYKVELAEVAVRRALQLAAGRPGGASGSR